MAARLNFCTIDKAGNVTDRRAGRIPDEENRRVLAKLRAGLKAPAGVEVFFETEAEHRAVHGPARRRTWTTTSATPTRRRPACRRWSPTAPPYDKSRDRRAWSPTSSTRSRPILADEPKANMILARGFAKAPTGRRSPSGTSSTRPPSRATRCTAAWPGWWACRWSPGRPRPPTSAPRPPRRCKDHTFVFAHFKYTDKTGEDGDLPGKVKRIEEMDAALPALLAAKPDVLIITGDHSTPPSLKAH